MSRIVMIPLLLWILSTHFPWRGHHGEQEILASVLFVLASITDGLDGYLARKAFADHHHGHAARPHRRQDHGD
jgi:CDP-diacylglycerol---glycerol-3-phosphate 3-phosphatidyltransferase